MHNRKHIRLYGFDYSSKRYYFFTLNIKGKFPSFGRIENKKMQLSPFGIIAQEQWTWLGNQYNYIDLISFVIMPDHVHGIIFIDSDYYKNHHYNHDSINGAIGCENNVGNGCDNIVGKGRDPSLHVTNETNVSNVSNETNETNETNKTNNNDKYNGYHKIKPLPELIGAYKTTVSKRIHLAGDQEFKWQNSFHDNIIRNTRSLNMIKNYIDKNPEHWNNNLIY